MFEEVQQITGNWYLKIEDIVWQENKRNNQREYSLDIQE